MKEILNVPAVDSTVFLTTDLVYSNRTEFCGGQYVPLKISLLRPRYHFACDSLQVLPTILFLCGGGWSETDHNVWLPELVYYAKRGYAVASIQYPVSFPVRFPESVECVKTAIRFLRSNAAELRLDMDRTVLMGESAGAYLALLCASTPGKYAGEKHADISDAVNAVVAFYPPTSPNELNGPDGTCVLDLPNDCRNYPSVLDSISEEMVPTMLLHGQDDDLVPVSHSRKIYEMMQKSGVDVSFLELEKANHADNKFFQPCIKERILAFIDRVIKS